MKTYNRIDKAFPGENIPAAVVIKGDDVRSGKVTTAIGRAEAARPGDRRRCSTRSRPPTARTGPSPRWRSRWTATAANDDVQGSAVDAAERHRPGDGRQGLRIPSVNVSGMTAQNVDSNEQMSSGDADRVRVRADAGVRAPAGHLPLDRDPDQGDRAEPAVGRRGVRSAGVRVPARPLREPAGLPLQRRSRPAGCRCSCSWCCSACRWTTTCSSSAGSARPSTAACGPRTRCPTGSRARPESSRAPRS